MLNRLQAIGRGARGQTRRSDARDEPQGTARPVSPADSVLLLVPSGGGMAFQLFAVESEAAAAAFVQKQYPQLAEKSITFRPRAAQPKRYAGEEGEALVLVADSERPGMVYVSSFDEMEAAESFLRFEEKNGMDMSLVTTYWGVPQPVAGIFRAPAGAGAVEPVTVGKVQPSRIATPAHFETVQQRKPAARTTAAVTEQKEGLADAIRNWPGWATVRARMVAVSVCDTDVYHDIQKDPIASSQARAIVAATAAATAVGAFWFGPVAIITYALMGVAGWLACAYLTHWVGTKLFTGRESEESKLWLFQLLAFAHAPRLLLFLGFFVSLAMPGFGLVLAIGAFVWALWASVPVVEETLELDQQSALLSAMTGWMAMFAIAQAAPLLIT
jgi:hypothetical protein